MAGGSVSPQLAALFQAAGGQHGIPPEVLAGIASVETNLGANRAVSSTGAQGLMQFEPGTARGLGVNPLDDKSAIFGAAKLLTQYGYHQNPARAIGAYNGGPGNPQAAYARQVLSEAARLKGQVGGGGAAPASPSGASGGGTFDQAGYDKAVQAYKALSAFKQVSGNGAWDLPGSPKVAGLSGGDPVLGLLHPTAPKQADYVTAHGNLSQLAGAPLAAHPATGGGGMLQAVSAADKLASNHYNYEWGGGHNAQFAPTHGAGHGSGVGTGFDCSGAISAILHAAGGLTAPMVASQFMTYGQPGAGTKPNDVTIYASPTHVFAQIGGKFFGTSAQNPGGGAGWFANASTQGFVARHVTL